MSRHATSCYSDEGGLSCIFNGKEKGGESYAGDRATATIEKTDV